MFMEPIDRRTFLAAGLQYAHWRSGSGTLETAPAFLG